MTFLRNFFDYLSEHRTAAIAGCIVIIVLGLFVIVRSAFRSGLNMPEAYPVWLYDENTDRLYVGSSHNIPPVNAPSRSDGADGRPAGVRAYVFGCGRCDEVGRVVVYLERFTPEAQQAKRELMRARARGETNRFRELEQQVNAGREVRVPQSETWSRADTVVAEGTYDAEPITILESIKDSFSRTCAQQETTMRPCTPE